MMNPYQSYRLHITPLSPVHIGTGQSYEPTNYVIEDGILHEFDTGSVIDAFSAKDREGLLAIANRKPNADMIKAIQLYFYERKERLKWAARNHIPVLEGVSALYAKNVGQTAQRESDGREVLNRLEIERCAFEPVSRDPVLYGSSLKGAIRTALLDKINQHSRAHERKGFHDFQGRLLKYRDPENGRWRLELDPLRLVQVADAHLAGPSDVPMAQVHLAVNRKKSVVPDSSGQPRKAMGENLYQILECVPGWRYRAFTGQVNLQQVQSVARQAEFPQPEFRWSISDIANACNDFYWGVLTSEMKIMSSRRLLDRSWSESTLKVLSQAKQRIERGNVFLLRVGRHSGAEAVTVSGARNGNISIMTPKGQPRAFADNAKTLWLAADTKDQQSDLLPFGWMLVEVERWEQPAAEWPELRSLCEPHLEQARVFAARLVELRKRFEFEKAEFDERRRAEAERARTQAEQERQASERLAAMTDNQRLIAKLRDAKGPGNKGQGPSGQLFSQARDLAKQSANWNEAEKEELRQALVEVFAWLNVNKPKAKEVLRLLDNAPS